MPLALDRRRERDPSGYHQRDGPANTNIAALRLMLSSSYPFRAVL
jgi:hypothetical protein